MGDNRHQVDTANLVFDDTNTPEMRTEFTKQDAALFKLLMADLPDDHKLRSRFMGGVATHHIGSTANERYRGIPNSACSFIRAILLMDKPLLPSFKKTLERDAKGITHRFKKGSPKKALGEALAILSRNKNHSVSVQIHDWLYNTLNILEARFPNQFGKLKQDYADDALNSEWNGMPDITEVLSTFISEELQPIAEAIELSQTQLARQHKMSELEMWDATSFEARSNSLLRDHSGDPSKEAAKKTTPTKLTPKEATETKAMQAQLNALQALTNAQAKKSPQRCRCCCNCGKRRKRRGQRKRKRKRKRQRQASRCQRQRESQRRQRQGQRQRWHYA